jgi:alpha-glucoside transport system permease protein
MDWLHDMLLNPTTPPQKIVVMFVAIALFVVVMGVILWLINRDRTPTWALVTGFLGPVVLFLGVGLLYPAIATIFDSFRTFNGQGVDIGPAGLSNYTYYFNGKNNIIMLVNTVLWVFLVPLFSTALGLIYAVLVDRTRFESVAKGLIFLPICMSMVAASVIWKYVYYTPAPKGKDQVGLLNAILTTFGIPAQNWTTSFPRGTFALIIVMIWIQAGFAMTLLSAAIKAVPDDIVEAAQLDGASGARMFFSVTVPSIRPTLVVVISTIAIAALKTFDIVATMGGNLPANDIVANAFRSAQVNLQNGRAGALAVMIFVLVTPVIVYNILQMRKADANR